MSKLIQVGTYTYVIPEFVATVTVGAGSTLEAIRSKIYMETEQSQQGFVIISDWDPDVVQTAVNAALPGPP